MKDGSKEGPTMGDLRYLAATRGVLIIDDDPHWRSRNSQTRGFEYGVSTVVAYPWNTRTVPFTEAQMYLV